MRVPDDVTFLWADDNFDNTEGTTITTPRLIKFRTGQRRKHWHKNCLALGLSSGFVEPLESTSLHLIMMGVIGFLRLFPGGQISDSTINEFNLQAKDEIEKIRDFIILHYKVIQREDSPFWQYCKSMDIPQSLAHRIEDGIAKSIEQLPSHEQFIKQYCAQ